MEQQSMRNGAKKIISGTTELTVATWQHVDHFVKSMPWLAICLVMILSITVAGSYMMQARAERNTAEAEYYQIQKQYDSLKICMQKQ